MPVAIFDAVEWKKLMWCFFNGKVVKVCLVEAAALKVGSVVKKSLENGVKDASFIDGMCDK